MKLKSLIVFTSFAISGVAFAASSPAANNVAPSLDNGMHVGIGVGYDASDTKVSVTGVWPVTENFAAQDPFGRVFAGYGYNFSSAFNLSGEVFYQLENGSTKMAQGNALAASNLNTQSSFGVEIMPGVNFWHNVRGFVSVGSAWTKLKYMPSFYARSYGAASSYSTWKAGLILGVGVDVAIANDVSMRFEYSHVNTKKYMIHVGSNCINLSPDYNQVLLGLGYHFNM